MLATSDGRTVVAGQPRPPQGNPRTGNQRGPHTLSISWSWTCSNDTAGAAAETFSRIATAHASTIDELKAPEPSPSSGTSAQSVTETMGIASTPHSETDDFGVAQLAHTGGLIETGAVVGTPTYMSPEQVRGDELDAARRSTRSAAPSTTRS